MNMSSMKKVLITGASGFVGSRAADALKNAYELLTPSHSEFDVTSAEDVERFILETEPDAILHLAAISDTSYCEAHPEESFLANVVSVENLARSAAKHNIKFVWFSSDQIYNGNRELSLLSEDIPVSPENHYGRHKLLAEQRAAEICPDSVALRATWMYDAEKPGMKTHKNFVLNFQDAIENRTSLRFATREFRGITWIEDVVNNIPFTFELPGGVYNYGAENDLNSFDTAIEYAKLLIKKYGLDITPEDLVIADTERFSEHIRNLSISMQKAYDASEGKIRFRTTLDGLAAYNQFDA